MRTHTLQQMTRTIADFPYYPHRGFETAAYWNTQLLAKQS